LGTVMGGMGGNGGVGARAHLGRAPRDGMRGAPGWGGGRSSWCLVPCVTQCLVRRGVTSNSHGSGVRTSPHTPTCARDRGGGDPVGNAGPSCISTTRLPMHASGHMRTSVAGGTVSSAAVVVPSSSGPTGDGADTTASPRVGMVADGEFRALCDPAPDDACAGSGRATPSATRRARPEN